LHHCPLFYLPQFNNTNAARLERCKRAIVELTVEGQVVLGQVRFEFDAPNVYGTVYENGAFGATIGFSPSGDNSPDEFQGTFKRFDCEWRAILRHAR
jgi:hypothetical protein